MMPHLDGWQVAEELLGDHMPANMVALGAAWQRGALPISRGALEEAIRLNGAAVDKNLAAFAWGRACVADPEAVSRAVQGPEAAEQAPLPLDSTALELVESVAPEGELRRLLEVRVPELIAYQSRRHQPAKLKVFTEFLVERFEKLDLERKWASWAKAPG